MIMIMNSVFPCNNKKQDYKSHVKSHNNNNHKLKLFRVVPIATTGFILLLLLVLLWIPTRNNTNNNTIPMANVDLSNLPSTILTSETDLGPLNQALSSLTLDQVLLWAYQVCSNDNNNSRLIQVTSFGPSGLVILHHLYRLGLLFDSRQVFVVSIDTLHLFPETYQFIQLLKTKTFPNIKINLIQPRHHKSRESFDRAFGPDLYRVDPSQYAYHSKVEPLLRVLKQQQPKIWITGRRRTQGGERTNLSIVELDDTATTTDDASRRWKLNPLAYWTHDDVWKYLRQHGIPYNPLHDQGYSSIGDIMTTQKTQLGAGERDGRFVGMEQTECGIHSTREKLNQMIQNAKAKKSIWGPSWFSPQHDSQSSEKETEPPPLPCTGCLELNPQTLMTLLKTGTTDVLMEFHSPFCGHCRHFAPTYEKVAQALLHNDHNNHHFDNNNIQVARFDITYQNVPSESGIVIEATPKLYFVKRLPQFKLEEYKGTTRSPEAILDWVTSLMNK